MSDTGQSSIKRQLNPNDRRVIRTRQLLRDSLLDLIVEKGYDAVTIQDITDRANLGRATFYIHYTDKQELLMGSLTAIFDDLVQQGSLSIDPNGTRDKPSHALITFRHAAQHRALYKLMLGSSGAPNLMAAIRDYLVEITKRLITAAIPIDQLSLPLDILAQHSVGSLLALLAWWLETDSDLTPEYMAETFRALNFGPIHQRAQPLNAGAL